MNEQIKYFGEAFTVIFINTKAWANVYVHA